LATLSGIGDCCARATSGQAAAEPSTVMNSRRLMSVSRAQDMASYLLEQAQRKGPDVSAGMIVERPADIRDGPGAQASLQDDEIDT
jgi:hypothetical protein